MDADGDAVMTDAAAASSATVAVDSSAALRSSAAAAQPHTGVCCLLCRRQFRLAAHCQVHMANKHGRPSYPAARFKG
eukprot:15445055-Alexandrium_andersonii.AAC.1